MGVFYITFQNFGKTGAAITKQAAGADLNIVCFRYRGQDADLLNAEIVADLGDGNDGGRDEKRFHQQAFARKERIG